MKGIVISGIGSGVGKTSIVTGLLSRLSRRVKVQPFKVGPDFIDPMYHSLASGRVCRNLDAFMVGRDRIEGIVGSASSDADLCIVEGVRGLYEGIDGIEDTGSTAEIAKILGFPVVLVIDARSLTRSVAAIINGFSSFDGDVNMAGVILNNVSGPAHIRKLESAIGHYCDTEIIGFIGRDPDRAIDQRYLGLDTVNENGVDRVNALADMVSEIDVDRLMDICEKSERDMPIISQYERHSCSARLAVPRDDAYCFYYRENLECLEAAGFDITYFSPLAGDPLPDADMYYLGGGYPEINADALSSNRDFIEGLRTASSDGRIVYGECGGLMTMCSRIIDVNGASHEMSGIFDADAVMSGRHGPMYCIASPTGSNRMFSETVKGHEFHYSELVLRRDRDFGLSLSRGCGIESGSDGLVKKSSMGTYLHQHALSCRDWAGGFVNLLK